VSDENLELKILGVDPGEEIAGALRLTIRTSRGEIPVILHAPDTATRAVVCISGAIGGFDGPAKLYERLKIRDDLVIFEGSAQLVRVVVGHGKRRYYGDP